MPPRNPQRTGRSWHWKKIFQGKITERLVDFVATNFKATAIFVLLAGLIFGNGISGITAKGYKNLAKVPAFDGTVAPLKYTLNWMSLSSEEFKKFKSGQLTYDNAGSKLLKIMKYDPARLCTVSPKNENWKSLSRPVKNSFLTYVTVFSGKYTSGSDAACEGQGSHLGIDIRAAKDTPIFAIANGIVVRAGKSASNGNYACILHPKVPSLDDPKKKENYVSCYLHMDKMTTGLQTDMVVKKGDQIGVVGQTGNSTTYHLHFQLDKESAAFYPYWPFTAKEAKTAGLDLFEAVNQGLNKDKALQYSISPMQWVQSNNTAPEDINIDPT